LLPSPLSLSTTPLSLHDALPIFDQRQPGYDGGPLVEWLGKSGLRFEILSEDTYSVVMDKLEPGSTYCSLCSRLRRGILYTAAERSEEHTSELQSRENLVCRLLLE